MIAGHHIHRDAYDLYIIRTIYSTMKGYHQRGGRKKWEEACEKVYLFEEHTPPKRYRIGVHAR